MLILYKRLKIQVKNVVGRSTCGVFTWIFLNKTSDYKSGIWNNWNFMELSNVTGLNIDPLLEVLLYLIKEKCYNTPPDNIKHPMTRLVERSPVVSFSFLHCYNMVKNLELQGSFEKKPRYNT